jgi:hypothetical protein
MSTAVSCTPTSVASFENACLDLCANVRELPDNEFEVAVVDALSGGIVVSRLFTTVHTAMEVAKVLTE